MSKKQCSSCQYLKRPTKYCACNNKVKGVNELVPMKFNGVNLPYCDAYKPEYKG